MQAASRMKILRDMEGKTQKEMALILNVNYRTYQNYENGVNKPGWEVFEAITRIGYDPVWLLIGEGEMRRRPASGGNQFAIGDGLVQVGGKVSGQITTGGKSRSADIEELCDLLDRYGSKALIENIKTRLMRQKEELEG
jgi:transcriptional regulator with XRE-family HTH domain